MDEQLDFLLEIGTEELPPKNLEYLAEGLAANLQKGLQAAFLDHGKVTTFATPRRLAVLVAKLASKQQDKAVELRGPAVSIAFDERGNLTAAGKKFIESAGVSIAQLERHKNPKGEYVVCKTTKIGLETPQLLPAIVTAALKNLPIHRPMRWGNGALSFVRPVHWVVMMYGSNVIEANILGVPAGNLTYGHRFLHPHAILLSDAQSYETALNKPGYVVANFNKRTELIRHQMANLTTRLPKGEIVIDEELLHEITGLVEWPVAMIGEFDHNFLELPQEVLICVMQQQQKCFPVIGADKKIQPYFILVSNIISKEPQIIIKGNERVIQARLTDAEFFYKSDLVFTLDSYLEKLKTTVFQTNLGTVYDKTLRLAKLATVVAEFIGANTAFAERAAKIAKSDLMTTMVGEFPELQGIMGYYYALQQFEPEEVAIALKEQYLPRFAKDKIPDTKVGSALALADRIDTLIGAFAINKIPTGEKDPLGLRRAAIAILRIILAKNLDIDLRVLFAQALQNYQEAIEALKNVNPIEQALNFVFERLRVWYVEEGIEANIVNAVLERRPTKPLDFKRRIEAVSYFKTLPAAETLSNAHKRVNNILQKAGFAGTTKFNKKLLTDAAEINLAAQITRIKKLITPLYSQGNYKAALTLLSEIKSAVDQFFDTVMVMAEEQSVRNNRLALLNELRELIIYIADI
jgi:glycyl-tRNA synthetase beta chain